MLSLCRSVNRIAIGVNNGFSSDRFKRTASLPEKIARQTVPKAAAQAIRTVGRQAMNKAVKSVAAEIGVNQKTIKGRAK
ncbi:phage tail protein [Mannheimia haemolytica]|uniref:phage tail protein n=1 Tax=Mannheimia haemolytica TaxID=75985 RepID=UPI0038F7EA65